MTRALRLSEAEYEQHQRRTKGGDRLAIAVTGGDASAKRAMNKWETQYAAELELRRKAGEVLWWAFEDYRLKIGHGAWYTPDFAVMVPQEHQGATFDSLEFHEVKGYRREAAMVRIRAAAKHFPHDFWIITRKDGNWVRMRI
jgi:hypothetical protein